MKRIVFILSLLSAGSLFAQKLPDGGLNTIRIYESDKTVVAEIGEVSENPDIKPDLFYYWYSANAIHSTQGGFSGQLLNGRYTEYYLNKNLKEQGFFKKGLKSGIWKTWNEDGIIKQTSNWKLGVPVPDGPVSVWEKIKALFHKILPHHHSNKSN
jgi:antitoxin component YwqK of YwqJK toxin-antitoxin module